MNDGLRMAALNDLLEKLRDVASISDHRKVRLDP
jgi:hypothetical protein